MAPELPDRAKGSKGNKDAVANDMSVRENLIETLEVEKNRLDADTNRIAQNERGRLMKEQFLNHFRRGSAAGTPSKVLLRFGRNHFHRGYDAWGISTLANFTAEFA